jgi:hypothetical protein
MVLSLMLNVSFILQDLKFPPKSVLVFRLNLVCCVADVYQKLGYVSILYFLKIR